MNDFSEWPSFKALNMGVKEPKEFHIKGAPVPKPGRIVGSSTADLFGTEFPPI